MSTKVHNRQRGATMLNRKVVAVFGLACGMTLCSVSDARTEVIFTPVKYENVPVSRLVNDMERGYRAAGFKMQRRPQVEGLGDGRVVDELIFTYKVKGIANLTGRVRYELTYRPGQKVCAPCEVLVQSLDTVGGKSGSQQEETLLEATAVADAKAIRNVGGLLGRRPVNDRAWN